MPFPFSIFQYTDLNDFLVHFFDPKTVENFQQFQYIVLGYLTLSANLGSYPSKFFGLLLQASGTAPLGPLFLLHQRSLGTSLVDSKLLVWFLSIHFEASSTYRKKMHHCVWTIFEQGLTIGSIFTIVDEALSTSLFFFNLRLV